MMDRIYMDHGATSPMLPEALDIMTDILRNAYGNPSSIHGTGRQARKIVEEARRQAAKALNALPEEIFFTSGGTEGDNWALRGMTARGGHVITSSVEHHAVLHTCAALEKHGIESTFLPVDENGRVRLEDAERAMRENTYLVSLMLANNEIGTIEPVKEVCASAHARGIPVHTDAVQAFGGIPVDVQELGVDILSLSAHKFGGPKGIGIMYVRKGTRLERYMTGGEQERRMRAGTENVASIAAAGAAMEAVSRSLPERIAKIRQMRDRLEEGIVREIPDVLINGGEAQRIPGCLNVSFLGLEGEAVLLRLDLAGIAASSGSACTAGSLDPSHVLMAIGRTRAQAQASVRFTLGVENSMAEVDEVLEVLPPLVADLRRLSGRA